MWIWRCFRMLAELSSGENHRAALANARKLEEKGFLTLTICLAKLQFDCRRCTSVYGFYRRRFTPLVKRPMVVASMKVRAFQSSCRRCIRVTAASQERDRVMEELYLSSEIDHLYYAVSTILVSTLTPKRPIVWRSPRSPEKLCFEPELGQAGTVSVLSVQAYQKRPLVIDYLIDPPPQPSPSDDSVGAKYALGIAKPPCADDYLEGYPVYTRKVYTDVSYLACAKSCWRC